MPGIVKFEFTEDEETYTAFLCPLCVFKAKELFAEAKELRRLDRLERSERGGPVIPGQ